MKKYILGIILIFIGCSSKDELGYEASGTIEGTEIRISSKISGVIVKNKFREGDEVKSSDTLLLIDNTNLEIMKLQSEAGVELSKSQYELLLKGARIEDVQQSEEQLNQANANYKIANDDYERMKSLFNDKSISKKQFDDAEGKYKIAKAQFNSAKQSVKKIKSYARPEELKSAKARLKQSEANLSLILQQLSDVVIKSPISGIITELPYEEGELAMQGGIVATVVNLNEVFLKLYLPENLLGKINFKNNVEVQIDGMPEKIFEGRVVYISPSAEFTPKNIQTKEDRTKLVYAIKVSIKNENNILKSGMPADAFIKFNSK